MKNSLKSLIYGSLLALPFGVSAQTFCEGLGSVGSTSTIAQASVGFNNTNFAFSGSADIRATSPSSLYTGATGSANVFFTNSIGKNFEISGINTSTLSSLGLSFGILKNTNAGTGANFAIETSTDGVTYTALSHTLLPTGSGTAKWRLMVPTGTIPAVSNLRIRFTNNDNTTQYRIDDICLSGGACDASIASGGATSFCNGGSVVLSANAGSAYLWSSGATTQTISVDQSGTHAVTVTAAGGCTAASNAVVVLEYPEARAGALSSNNICGSGSSTLTGRALATDLFFSEYVEGSSLNKSIEIYNGTGAAVTLSNYVYSAFHNGATTPNFTLQLSGTLADGAVLVLSNTGATYTNAILTNTVDHNGNDALGLFNTVAGTYVDIFGSIGHDPIANWTATGGISTVNHTLRRKSSVYAGISVNPNFPGQSGFPTLLSEWDQFPIDDISDLGAHSMNGSAYSWIPATAPSTGAVVIASPTVTTIYTVTANYAASGCSGNGTVQVNVFQAVTVGEIDNTAPEITFCFGDQCSELTAIPSSGTGPFTYSWNTGSTSDIAVVCPTVAGTYVYTVVVTDANGCSGSQTATVTAIDACCEGTNVIVCHMGSTLCVTPGEVNSYIGQGATVGPCSGRPAQATGIAKAKQNSNIAAVNVYPNPFNNAAIFEVNVVSESNIKVEVMDFTGKKVAELNNSVLPVGTHKFEWSGNNATNGLYFCRIVSGNKVQTVKVQKLSDK